MKQLFLFLAIAASFSSIAQVQNISGNGNRKKEMRDVSSFSGLSLSGNIHVKLQYGTPGKIEVEADENLLPYIETNVENNTLVIKTKKKTGLSSKGRMTVYVTANQLNDVGLSGSGNVSGHGDFTASGKNRIAISGSGNIDLGYATMGDVQLAISGSGDIKLKGRSAKSVHVAISGSGNVDAQELVTEDASVAISGSGNVRVHTNNSLNAKVSGAGNIYYKGNPGKINTKAVGSGKVIKV